MRLVRRPCRDCKHVRTPQHCQRTGYAEVARALGLDPFAQLRAAGLNVACLTNPDCAFTHLLELSAHAAGVDDFGLRMAVSRRLSNLGLVALSTRDEPTVRDAVR